MTGGAADEQGLLRAVLEDPACDASRLVYADWCEDNGRPSRAEMIREQVSGRCGPIVRDRRDSGVRTYYLSESHVVLSKRGFYVRPEWKAAVAGAWPLSMARAAKRSVKVTIAGGFACGVKMYLQHFNFACAERLFAFAPLTSVGLYNAVIRTEAGVGLHRNRLALVDGTLHGLWDLMCALYGPVGPQSRVLEFAALDAADGFLSRCCVAWGRKLAGLPPLKGDHE